MHEHAQTMLATTMMTGFKLRISSTTTGNTNFRSLRKEF
jgi:hypothetical protein